MNAKSWLLSPTPTSSTHARVQKVYIGWLSFRSNFSAMMGLCIILLLVATAILAPVTTSGNGLEQNLADRLQAPSWSYALGTDELGRSVYQRIVWGSRYTLYIVFLVSIIVMPVGLFVGIFAGYAGGWVDSFLMRMTDVFLAFPRLVLALALVAILGPGLENAILAIAFTSWAPYARMARAETLSLRKAEFVEVILMQGGSRWRILFKHIAPMCLSSAIIRLTLDMSGVILSAAGLGFLGLGAQPPTPEWGAMISTGAEYILDQWWLAAIPGTAIVIVSLGFNLLGDGLRDVLDPRSQGQGR